MNNLQVRFAAPASWPNSFHHACRDKPLPGHLLSLGFGLSFLNVTESNKRIEDRNARVHDDRVMLAVLSSEFEDPFEGAGEHTDSWILNPSLLQPSYKRERV